MLHFGDLAILSDIRYLMIAMGVLLIATTVGPQWTHWILVPELGDSRANIDVEEEALVQIDSEGYLQSSHRDPDLTLAVAPRRVSGVIAIQASLSVFTLTLSFFWWGRSTRLPRFRRLFICWC